MKNNHPIPHNRFKKTAIRYRTSFHDPIQKLIRQQKRVKKARIAYPMPTSRLYPIVRCPTLRHNNRERLGRGFTLEECQHAGYDHEKLKQYGISIDFRRRNHNNEAFLQNVERIKTYMSRLVFFNNRQEAKESQLEQYVGTIMPIVKKDVEIGQVNVESINASVWAADKVKELIEETKYKRGATVKN